MRPSGRELSAKLALARAAVAAGDWLLANPMKQAGESRELDLFTCQEQTSALAQCLEEISPADYAGKRLPDRSYERAIKDRELFAFVWDSEQFGCRTYLKFALVGSTLYIVSLHKAKF